MKSKFNLRKVLNLPVSLSEKFHEKTKYKTLPSESLHPSKWPSIWKIVQFKSYFRMKETNLPAPNLPNDCLFKDILINRRTDRVFSEKPVTLESISSIIHYSSGLRIRKSSRFDNRFYPSAGARYPLEIYCILNKTSFPKGLYHYYVKNHSLEELLRFEAFDYKKYFNQDWISKSAVIILITAVFGRTTVKYGDVGYRHILLEAGHLGQNIYLLTTALNIKCCSIGAYIDDNLNKLLDIDGVKESVVYALALGN